MHRPVESALLSGSYLPAAVRRPWVIAETLKKVQDASYRKAEG